jgi:CubicO group peptidase (beta-lactamase class C family)
MTLRDYARVALFVVSGAKAAGKRVVPEWYLKEATSSQIMAPAMGSYGYFWWIGAAGSFSARGIYGQSIQVIPNEKLVVVTNAAWPTAVPQEYQQSQAAFMTAVRAAL